MARAGGGLERFARTAGARPWRLRHGGGDGDGRRKKTNVVNCDPLAVYLYGVPPGPPVAAPSSIQSSLKWLHTDNFVR
jgi:hypothetical protein